jgi:hypothetical protein
LGQFHFLSAKNQVGFRPCRKAILPAEFNRTAGTTLFTLGTEQAFAKVDTQDVLFFFYGTDWTTIDAKFASRCAFGGINDRPAPKSFRKHGRSFWKRNSPVFLLQYCEQRFYHFVTL